MKKIILWVLSIFLLLMSLALFSSSILSGILLLLTAIGCNPIVLSILKNNNKKISNIIYIPILIALFIISMVVYPSDNDSKQVSSQKSKETESILRDTTKEFNGKTYKIIEVDGGDLSGTRQKNVAVDIGYGDREYWAYTNEYGQLIAVTAEKVTLQDSKTESVNSDGRYYDDEAKVPGVEQEDLDEGHIIADSLGGVSNAYNITPQDSTLNRNGDQAYMEKVIRDAGGCENFVATITYPDTTTQIPSHYHYEYILKGEKTVDDFDNVNPDTVNQETTTAQPVTQAPTQIQTQAPTQAPVQTPAPTQAPANNLSSVDTNGDGKVTIAEAEAAGYSMPIYSNHWLYPYMDDRDHDGMVGE